MINNNQPTPETDAAWAAESGNGLNEVKEISRKLERERDEARERIERQKLEINRLNGATNHAGGTPLKIALRERDEARELLESEKITRNHIIKRSVEVEKERNEARKKCAAWVREWRKLRVLCRQLDEDASDRLQERDEAMKELEEYRSIAENIGAKKAVSEKEKAISERDETLKIGNNLADECERILGLGLHQNTLPRFKAALEAWRKNT